MKKTKTVSLGKNGAHELIERRQLFLVHELELSAGVTLSVQSVQAARGR